MAGLRKLDAFAKPRHELRSKSAVGGIITAVAASTAALLFVAQCITYIMGNPTHSLHLAQSQSIPLLPLSMTKRNTQQIIMQHAGKVPMFIHVVFPYLQCSNLEFKHDGATFSSGDLEKIHGKHFLKLRTPTNAELRHLGATQSKTGGCTIQGKMLVPRVGGSLSIIMNRRTWREATLALLMGLRSNPSEKTNNRMSEYNVSHYIDHVRFGRSTKTSSDNPLEGRVNAIDNKFGGMALEEIDVKLIPSVRSGFFMDEQTFQLSVVDHTVEPETMVESSIAQYPGLSISYDFTPLAVHYSSGRDNLFVFLSSLISIVGGVFVTVGLVTGCLVHSAQAVAKKID